MIIIIGGGSSVPTRLARTSFQNDRLVVGEKMRFATMPPFVVCGRVSIRGRAANSSIGGREFEWVAFCQPSGEARVAYIPRGESSPRLTRLLTGRGRVPVCRKRNVRR